MMVCTKSSHSPQKLFGDKNHFALFPGLDVQKKKTLGMVGRLGQLGAMHDTMHHADVILIFKTFLDTEKNLGQRCSLLNVNLIYFLNNISFFAMSEQKKILFTSLKSPLL